MIDRRIERKEDERNYYLQRGKRMMTVLKDVIWKSNYQIKELKRIKKKIVKSENFGDKYYRSLYHDCVIMSFNLEMSLNVLEDLRGQDWDVRDRGCCNYE